MASHSPSGARKDRSESVLKKPLFLDRSDEADYAGAGTEQLGLLKILSVAVRETFGFPAP
jgi:hypothetical protein